MREFVERQEMFFLASSDGGGACDGTFRAGPAGFVQVVDERRLTWAEYRGNGVMASLGNITENPHVGLLFIDFFRDVIGLHVNGLADTDDDTAMRASHPQLASRPFRDAVRNGGSPCTSRRHTFTAPSTSRGCGSRHRAAPAQPTVAPARRRISSPPDQQRQRRSIPPGLCVPGVVEPLRRASSSGWLVSRLVAARGWLTPTRLP
jgi:hypothetical protein